jgi:class 3 adenylate cyclase
VDHAHEIRVERLMPRAEHQRATGGERRQLTVLFADMVGSTALAQTMDPEDFEDSQH